MGKLVFSLMLASSFKVLKGQEREGV